MGGSSHSHSQPWKRLGDGSLLTEDADEGLGHVVEKKVFDTIFVTLLFLTVITVVVTRFDFGHFNTVVAILIASVKAALVATFFMHLKFETKTIWLYVLYPLVLLGLLVGSNLLDVMVREHPMPSNYKESPATTMPASSHVNNHS